MKAKQNRLFCEEEARIAACRYLDIVQHRRDRSFDGKLLPLAFWSAHTKTATLPFIILNLREREIGRKEKTSE